MCVIMHVN